MKESGVEVGEICIFNKNQAIFFLAFSFFGGNLVIGKLETDS